MKSVVSSLGKIRSKARTEFKIIFDDTAKLGKKLHGQQFEIKKPRTTGRQAHRSNPDVESAEDFFRITLFDEFVSHVVSELQDRFVNKPST